MPSASYRRAGACQLLVSVVLLLACSSGMKGAYAWSFFRPHTVDAPYTPPPYHPDSLPPRPVEPGLDGPVTPVRPVPGTAPAITPAEQRQQATTAALKKFKEEVKQTAKEEARDFVIEQAVQMFANMTCQIWCQSRCEMGTQPRPTCINTEGQAEYWVSRNDVAETPSNKQECDKICKAVDAEMRRAGSTSAAATPVTAAGMLLMLGCGIATLASLAFM